MKHNVWQEVTGKLADSESLIFNAQQHMAYA